MEILDLNVSCNALKMEVLFNLNTGKELISPVYNIYLINFQLKLLFTNNNVNQAKLLFPNKDESNWYLLVKFNKSVDDNELYILKVNSTKLNINSKTYLIDDSDWRVVGNYSSEITNFDFEINIETKNSPFRILYDDDSLTDFEIKGTDGSVSVHKAILAITSDVFKQMLTINFKEKLESRVELPYSKCVLQDLKKYLYLNKLNDNNLENLLLLSKCYMMNDLAHKCIHKLAFNITTEKLLELIEFAVVNKITDLLIALLKAVQEKKVNVDHYEITLAQRYGEGEKEKET